MGEHSAWKKSWGICNDDVPDSKNAGVPFFFPSTLRSPDLHTVPPSSLSLSLLHYSIHLYLYLFLGQRLLPFSKPVYKS